MLHVCEATTQTSIIQILCEDRKKTKNILLHNIEYKRKNT